VAHDDEELDAEHIEGVVDRAANAAAPLVASVARDEDVADALRASDRRWAAARA
jgi:hypothetical protein